MINVGNKYTKIYCPVSDDPIHLLLKVIIIQAVQGLTDLCQHILNICTILK